MAGWSRCGGGDVVMGLVVVVKEMVMMGVMVVKEMVMMLVV